MSIKKLNYPADNSDSILGINTRLHYAHVHDNLTDLNEISKQTLEDISTIKNKANSDLSNVTKEDFKKASENANVAFEDVVNEGVYGRANGKWVELTETTSDTFTSIGGTVLITENAKKINLEVSKNITDSLSDLAQDKLNKLQVSSADNIVVTKDDGTISASSKNIEDILEKSDLVRDVESNDDFLPASTALTYQLNQKIKSAIAGLGQNKGVVINAYTQLTEVYSLIFALIEPASGTGSGYSVGDHLFLPGLVDATIMVKSVNDDSGAITSVNIVNAGVFSTLINGSQKFFGGSGTDCTLRVNSAVTTTTTLNSIENPIEGDTVYVLYDETHNNSKSLYSYGQNGWQFVMTLSSNERNFITDPIVNNEIADNTISYTKLDAIPSQTILGNMLATANNPQAIDLKSLFNESTVTSISYTPDNPENNSGKVTILPDYLKLINFQTLPESDNSVSQTDNVTSAIAKLQAQINYLTAKLSNVSSKMPNVVANLVESSNSSYNAIITGLNFPAELFDGFQIRCLFKSEQGLKIPEVTNPTLSLEDAMRGPDIPLGEISSDGRIVEIPIDGLNSGYPYTLTYTVATNKQPYWIVNITIPQSKTILGDVYAIVEPVTEDPDNPAIGKMWIRTDL